ncbi:gag-pol [Trichonephila clavipes]|nr:gag-pol [Trichonephila clavipes]
MISPYVEQNHLSSYIDSSEGLPGVYFYPNLSAHVNKTSDPPEFLRQLALEVISNIPEDAFLIYTDGSRNEHSRSESGIYIKSQIYSSHIKLRNTDGCSVFRRELIAIDTGLKEALSIPGSNSLWILSDSRNVIQHLSNWHKVGDNTGVAILEKLINIFLLLVKSIYNGFLHTLTSRAMRLLTP